MTKVQFGTTVTVSVPLCLLLVLMVSFADKIGWADLAGSMTGFADGIGAAAKFDGAAGLCYWFDEANDRELLFVADSNNHRIRQIDVNTGLFSFCGPVMKLNQ